jgi:hypothetical protein
MDSHRIIFSLHLSLEPRPGSPAGAFAGLVIPLDRDGMAIGRNGRPRPPKQRTIDLRIGDDVMVNCRWRRVLGISAYRDGWIRPEQADAIGGGYVVKPAALA